MYKQHIEHKIISEVRNDFPFLKIGVKFNDLFSKDIYVLESGNKKNNYKNIPFCLYKNNSLIKECELVNLDINKLLEDAFQDIEDYDLKRLFSSQCKQAIIKEVTEFFEFYDKLILVNEITLEGEIRKMKRMAGITPKVLY